MELDSFFDAGKQHKLIENAPFARPEWSEVVSNIDLHVQTNTFIKVLEKFGIVTHDGFDIPQTHVIKNILQKKYPNQRISSHVYISLSSNSKTFLPHADDVDVWVWQCIGVTHWIVYDDKTFEYSLVPGSMLHVPKGMYHETKPLSPRVLISFGVQQ